MYLTIVSTIAFAKGVPFVEIIAVFIADLCCADVREDINRLTSLGLNVEMVNL